ncbi:hypothetical protein ACU615_12965 [Klebsiella aerogenes]
MTDITRLLASLKRRSAHAKEFGHDVLFVKLEDIDALVEALEKAQSANAAQDDHINQPQDRIDILEKRNAELGREVIRLQSLKTVNAARQEAESEFHRGYSCGHKDASLGARTVTVKLPSLNPATFNGDVMFGYRKAQKEAVEFCSAAGIKVEVESWA